MLHRYSLLYSRRHRVEPEWRTVSEREMVHRLLHLASREIRSTEGGAANATAERLADLLADVPLHLEVVAQGRGNFAETLARLRAAAQQVGMGEWVSRGLVDYDRHQDFL
jgi:hypothetical protein